MRRSLPPRTARELQDAVTHVAYERVGLDRALHAFQRPKAQGGCRRFDLEAALVHARNLTDFFWAPIRRRQPHPNGIYAAHYLPPGVDWTAIRKQFPQLPDQCYDAISAQLSHVSVARTSQNGARDFAAEIGQVATDLDAAWNRWRTELQATPWAAALDVEVSRWQAAP